MHPFQTKKEFNVSLLNTMKNYRTVIIMRANGFGEGGACFDKVEKLNAYYSTASRGKKTMILTMKFFEDIKSMSTEIFIACLCFAAVMFITGMSLDFSWVHASAIAALSFVTFLCLSSLAPCLKMARTVFKALFFKEPMIFGH